MDALESSGDCAQQSDVKEVTGESPDESRVGEQIGRYRLERLIDRGGMGVVYLASRVDDFEQRVALKLVDPRLHTGEILDRFYRERQILADLQHPNIAHLLDGGSTCEALPYIVMEYVDGLPVDRYCDEQELSLRQRLELFCQICEAVHFAHQNLVVHRDLKPSNILITRSGSPKLLDFGIAKILQPETARSWRQHSGAKIHPLTPGYASPEQVLDRSITTVSDVYSLGVLLYRLTSGRSPYQLKSHSSAELLELVCRKDPPAPSQVEPQRLRKSGQSVSTTIGEFRRWQRGQERLEGDIDAIVLKAMQKEPKNRYASALRLSEDIRRHLTRLPVSARRQTWPYLASQFARRHKLAFSMLGIILGFALTATLQWREAIQARARAERGEALAVEQSSQAEAAQLKAEQVSRFLEGLFKSADPDNKTGTSISVREIVDRGRRQISSDLADQPEVRAELASVLGTVYNNLGLYSDARELKEQGLGWRREASTMDRPALATDLNNLGRLQFDLSDYHAAEESLLGALGIWKRLGKDTESATTMLNLASVASALGRHSDALALHQEVLEIRYRLLGPEHLKVGPTLYSLGIMYLASDRAEQAEELLRRALGIYRQHYGSDHPKYASVLASLGRTLHVQGRLDEAQESLEEALRIRRHLLGIEHPHVARAETSLAAVSMDRGDRASAAALLRRALATVHGSSAPAGQVAETESVWGAYLAAEGRFSEAREFLVTGYRELSRIKGTHHRYTRDAWQRLVDASEASNLPLEVAQPPHPMVSPGPLASGHLLSGQPKSPSADR